MRFILAISLLLLLAVPAPAWAAMPGDTCGANEIGSTKLADDNQNIIGCLKTGQDNPAQIWKATTSGGGGVTRHPHSGWLEESP